MSWVIYFGICLLGCLVFNPLVEGDPNITVAARSSCGYNALFYKQYCYHLINNYVSWAEAEVMCQELKEGAHLASIRSSNEGEIVYNYLKRFGATSVWIGLQASGSMYLIWQWSDGSSFIAPLWDGGNPTTSLSTSKCISMQRLYMPSMKDDYDWKKKEDFPKWLQRPCSDTLPFLCKYRAGF